MIRIVNDGLYNQLWKNLEKYAVATKSGTDYIFDQILDIIEECNGILYTDHIRFDNEEQASLFVLRFS